MFYISVSILLNYEVFLARNAELRRILIKEDFEATRAYKRPVYRE